jgi:hypothetical protein
VERQTVYDTSEFNLDPRIYFGPLLVDRPDFISAFQQISGQPLSDDIHGRLFLGFFPFDKARLRKNPPAKTGVNALKHQCNNHRT